jgi:hypothetical protein
MNGSAQMLPCCLPCSGLDPLSPFLLRPIPCLNPSELLINKITQIYLLFTLSAGNLNQAQGCSPDKALNRAWHPCFAFPRLSASWNYNCPDHAELQSGMRGHSTPAHPSLSKQTAALSCSSVPGRASKAIQFHLLNNPAHHSFLSLNCKSNVGITSWRELFRTWS